MPAQTINLTKSEEVAEGTMAFHFTRPSGFEFRAGQSVDITLIDPPETDTEGNTRAFSIASPPFEDHLMIATRMRDSAFKRVLRQAPQGLTVKLEGPSGSFTLHKNAAKPAVFLAGGIGITPFLSIARQAARDKPQHPLYLFYSNRRPEDSPFLDVLSGLPMENPNFHFIATMTAMAKSHWQWAAETGGIGREMLVRHVPEPVGPIYYIAGPPAMVAAMRQMLGTAGVDEDDIRTEEFSGY
jgi:ferredoxin-NADP reductase